MHYSCLRRCRNSPASQHFSYNKRSLQKKKQQQKSEADTLSGVGLLQSMGPSELRGVKRRVCRKFWVQSIGQDKEGREIHEFCLFNQSKF